MLRIRFVASYFLVVLLAAGCGEVNLDADAGSGDADDADDGVASCSDPGAPDCGTQGSCVDTSGTAVCECEFPYEGATCTACAPGFTDNGGVCEAQCETACGEHERCGLSGSTPTCLCVRGYEDDGDGCVWKGAGVNGGGLLDEKLGDSSVWTRSLFIFDEARFGAGDGAVEVDPIGKCGESSLGQVFDMPDYADAEPFVLEIEYFNQSDEMFDTDLQMVARIGDGEMRIPFGRTDGTVRMCLGSGAYGPGVDLRIGVDTPIGACLGTGQTPKSRLLRRISIKPAAGQECTAPGEIPNGTFAADANGWTFSMTGTTATTPAGELRLDATSGYNKIEATTSLSVPRGSALANPALSITYRSELGSADYQTAKRYPRLFEVSLNGLLLSRIGVEDGAANKTAVICLPEWSPGMAYALMLSGNSASNTAYPEGPDPYYSMWFDNLELISDDTCAGRDGGFERSIESSRWISTFPIWAAGDSGIRTGTGNAHTGDGVWKFQPAVETGTFNPTASQFMRVPVGDASGNPQVRFWHRADNLTPFAARFQPSTDGYLILAPTAAWQEASVCIDKRLSGQVIDLRWSMNGNADGAVHTYWLDDIVMELSADCP